MRSSSNKFLEGCHNLLMTVFKARFFNVCVVFFSLERKNLSFREILLTFFLLLRRLLSPQGYTDVVCIYGACTIFQETHKIL